MTVIIIIIIIIIMIIIIVMITMMIITMKYRLRKLNNTATSSIFAPTGYSRLKISPYTNINMVQ